MKRMLSRGPLCRDLKPHMFFPSEHRGRVVKAGSGARSINPLVRLEKVAVPLEHAFAMLNASAGHGAERAEMELRL